MRKERGGGAHYMSSRAIARSNALFAASRLLSQCTSSASKALQRGRGRESRDLEYSNYTQIFDAAGSIPAVLFVVAVGDELLDFLLRRVLRRHPLVGVQVAQRQGRRRHQTQRPKTLRRQPYSHKCGQVVFQLLQRAGRRSSGSDNVVSYTRTTRCVCRLPAQRS